MVAAGAIARPCSFSLIVSNSLLFHRFSCTVKLWPQVSAMHIQAAKSFSDFV
jgi:hypothetical protein